MILTAKCCLAHSELTLELYAFVLSCKTRIDNGSCEEYLKMASPWSRREAVPLIETRLEAERDIHCTEEVFVRVWRSVCRRNSLPASLAAPTALLLKTSSSALMSNPCLDLLCCDVDALTGNL